VVLYVLPPTGKGHVVSERERETHTHTEMFGRELGCVCQRERDVRELEERERVLW